MRNAGERVYPKMCNPMFVKILAFEFKAEFMFIKYINKLSIIVGDKIKG